MTDAATTVQPGRVFFNREDIIPVHDHPSNLAKPVKLASGLFADFAIFEVPDGFIACYEGTTFPTHFESYDAALEAVERLKDAWPDGTR